MIERLTDVPKDLEGLVATKEPRLPGSIRKYIRDLKAEGRWEEAMEVAQQVRERKAQKREEKAREELNRTILELLTTNDPEVEGEKEIRAIWLLEAAGVINSEERLEELLESLDTKAPQLKDFLDKRLAAIRDEVELRLRL